MRYASHAWNQNLSHLQKSKWTTMQKTAFLWVTRGYPMRQCRSQQEGYLSISSCEKTWRNIRSRNAAQLVCRETSRWEFIRTPVNGKTLTMEDNHKKILRKYFSTVWSCLGAQWVLLDYWLSQVMGAFEQSFIAMGWISTPYALAAVFQKLLRTS